MKKSILAAILLVLFALNAFAATLLPMPKLQFLTNSGTVLNGGKIYFYEPSSSTLKTVYSDSTESTPLTNPVVLDSAGRASIWLSGCYRVVVKTSADVTLYTTENVCEYAEANPTVSQWQASGFTPTYISATSFSVSGDQTATLIAGLRIKTVNTAGTIYSTIVSRAYTTLTTVTVINDSGSLDSGLSDLSLSMLTVLNTAIPITPVSIKTTDYTISPINCGHMIIMNLSTAGTLTVPNANTVPSGCSIVTKATGSTVTLAGTIDGVASPTVAQYEMRRLFSNGTSWYGDFARNALIGMQIFTAASGTYTPTVGTRSIIVELIGGGGGGGGCASATGASRASSGGGGGGFALKRFTGLVSGTTYTYSVGAGGAGGSAGANPGNAGNNTVFYGPSSNIITAYGGGAGQASDVVSLGGQVAFSSGSAISTNGDINGAGQTGGNGFVNGTTWAVGGKGGDSIFGGGRTSGVCTSGTGAGSASAAVVKGAGGNGCCYCNVATGSTVAGANGADGTIIVWEYN